MPAQGGLTVGTRLKARQLTLDRHGVVGEHHADQERRAGLPLAAFALAQADGRGLTGVAVAHRAAQAAAGAAGRGWVHQGFSVDRRTLRRLVIAREAG